MQSNDFAIFKLNPCNDYLVLAFNIDCPCCEANITEFSAFHFL